MKKILGLDLGTGSIGWALVNEAEKQGERSAIIKTGVRVNPLTVDEQTNFEAGKTITTTADRTLKRSMRRGLQRYKLRREKLIECLKKYGIISDETPLNEGGNKVVFQTYASRARAVTEEISLEELGRVLLQINKKRGYKSSRKSISGDEGQQIDGMAVAKRLYDEHLTPGQYVLALMRKGKRYVPDFYRSDLVAELQRIWEFQQHFYPEILTDEFYQQIEGRAKLATSKVFYAKYNIHTADNKEKDKRLQNYKWRVDALDHKVEPEVLAAVVCELNGAINNSSGYLGAMSDRSKELYFQHQTVGQYIMDKLARDPHFSLRNMVFYRQDYLDEFEAIWQEQSKHHPQLTDAAKRDIRDICIFYQRPLRSKKGMLDVCTFENHTVQVTEDCKKRTKVVGLKVCPKSSPLFQEFKIWQILNNLTITDTTAKEWRYLDQSEKELLFAEACLRDRLSKSEVLKLLFGKASRTLELNYKEIEGNRTQAALVRAYMTIMEMSGHDAIDVAKAPAQQVMDAISRVFAAMGAKTDFLQFDSSLQGHAFDQQPAYQLWHLLYSYEGDNSKTGIESLITKIMDLTGLEKDYARVLANVSFQEDYGSLSAKAIRRILPYLRSGDQYDQACAMAGYKHSERSLTREELDAKELKNRLEILPKNALRNPVVEKILNQMIHVVNGVIECYGQPDEIRIEMARELKKSAKERDQMSRALNEATRANENYRKILQEQFGIIHVSRNDILRYRLYEELKNNGYRTLYSDTYIPREKLFSKEFDIEHIIPQARLFDDSFSNKTLEARTANIEKSNQTAMDYVTDKYDADGVQQYRERVDALLRDGSISKSKHDKLLMTLEEIPQDFLERDLRNTQYIAVKAREILEEVVRRVIPTTGAVTDRLREDWQLVDVMQELNWDKYARQGLTECYKDKDGREIRKITGWTKRNDHRHHAMDALTIAFTKEAYIQYLNNLNARSDKAGAIYAIEKSCLYRDNKGKLRFCPPIPLDEFRSEAKEQLENVIVSIKAKNKVMTPNVNRTASRNGKNVKVQLTPRGQLHNETIYGSIQRYATREVKVGSGMDAATIALVAKKVYREALLKRLQAYDGDAKKAFSGKNSLEKNPLWLDEMHTQAVPAKVKLVEMETLYPIRKAISPDLKIEKVLDAGARRVLEARLAEYGGDAKKAFSNLDENPIWLNRDKGISIKSVTISGIANATSLREKRDHNGNFILDKNGRRIPVDFVNPGNNHHIAIYRDSKGKLQEHVVSFLKAVERASMGLPIVDRDYRREDGWEFLFTMKQNEYFVFPDEQSGFDPSQIDLMDPANAALISPHLFRVQKLTTKDYFFRHHLETTVVDNLQLKGIIWRRITSPDYLKDIIKVRVNHIGQIVKIGEYR